jgi:hypothetical protein
MARQRSSNLRRRNAAGRLAGWRVGAKNKGKSRTIVPAAINPPATTLVDAGLSGAAKQSINTL